MKIGFDLDDTLIYNQYRYHGPMLEAANIICRELGPKALHPQQIFDLFEKHDQMLRAEIMHSVCKLPMAWARTYDEVCAMVGKKPDPFVRNVIKRVAGAFAHGPWILFPETIETLQKLADTKKHELYLVTSGPELLQWQKIRNCRLEKFFAEIFIVPMSKKEILREIAGANPSELVFADDLMRNINHCMEVGGYGILMQTYTPYKQEAPTLNRFVRASSITEVPRIIDSLENKK